jgi:hypothetical protein
MGPTRNKLNAPFGPIPIQYPIAYLEMFIFLRRFHEQDRYIGGVRGIDEQVQVYETYCSIEPDLISSLP